MAQQDVQRKLTAILCTDVVGYSRLMGDDHNRFPGKEPQKGFLEG